MKYCSKCGKQLYDEAVFCPNCGCAAGGSTQSPNPYYEAEKPGLSVAALICAFLVPLAGLICGSIGISKYKTPNLKNRCIAAVVISIVVWIISFAISYATSSYIFSLI